MAKMDARYFSHDSGARNDEKIKKLRIKHGANGYGIYFMLVELLFEATDYVLEYDLEALAFDLRVPKKIIKSVIEDFKLFVIEDGKFYSESLNRRVAKIIEKSKKGKESAIKRWDNDNTQHIKTDATESDSHPKTDATSNDSHLKSDAVNENSHLKSDAKVQKNDATENANKRNKYINESIGTLKDTLSTSSCCERKNNENEIVFTIPLEDKTEYEICSEQYKKWCELYPAVDIMQSFRNMAGWLDAKPERRKTRRGAKTFINHWLTKAQEDSKNINNKASPTANRHNFFSEDDYTLPDENHWEVCSTAPVN